MAEARRHLASELGCILDCDLNTGLTAGGAPATDNTAILNALLATASATTPVFLLLDGPTLTTGIVIKGGHTTIEGIGPDSGFFLKSGSNSHVIRNEPTVAFGPGSGHPAPPRSNFGISLRHFRVNGNRGDGHTGNASSGLTYDNSSHPMLYGIYLVNCTSLWIEDLLVHDATTYAICLGNCASIVCRGLRIEAPSRDRNTDGLHINGPASDILIADSYFQTGDDPIALNAPEDFGGPIARVAITNCVFDHAPTAIRIYGCAVPSLNFPVSHVTLSNCTGLIENTPFMLGFRQRGAVDNVRDVTVSNCSFQADFWATLNESCGTLSFHASTWDSPTLAGHFLWIPLPVTLSSVTIADCRIYRSQRGNASATLLHAADDASGSTIARLAIQGFAIESEAGMTFPSVPWLIDTRNVTIAELYIAALDPANITALVHPAHGFAGIASIAGPGVLATGFPIPDDIMAENTPYISASAHPNQPCIKRDGKVKTL